MLLRVLNMVIILIITQYGYKLEEKKMLLSNCHFRSSI